MRFLDANIFLRYLIGEDAAKQAACQKVFERIEEGIEEAYTTEAVIIEVVHVLSSPKLYNVSRQEVHTIVAPFLLMKGLHLEHTQRLLHALHLYQEHASVDFVDIHSIVTMGAAHIQEVYSYDHHYDRFTDITRVEP